MKYVLLTIYLIVFALPSWGGMTISGGKISTGKDSNIESKLKIFEGDKFQIPNNLDYQVSDKTLEHYYQTQDTLRFRTEQLYLVKPSKNPIEFKMNLEKSDFIDRQLKTKSIFSYLYFESGLIVYDEVSPIDRFKMKFVEESYFASHSVGKSITSYMLGHAICQGYIKSIDAPIIDWPLMANTLYFGQPLINLLNMKAGDTDVIRSMDGQFIKTGRNIHGGEPLRTAVENIYELKNTRPIKNAQFAYSNLTADILFNYVMHRVGDDFDKFIANFYQKKIRIKYPVYLSMNNVLPRLNKYPSTQRRIAQGAGQYGITATRYDYLRIAKAMMDDWQGKTCEGLYLRKIYERAIDTKNNLSWNTRFRDSSRYADFGMLSRKYAGQFWTKIPGLENAQILVMVGADGQQIAMDMNKSRIVVINAGQEGYYNTRKLGLEPLKYGRIQ